MFPPVFLIAHMIGPYAADVKENEYFEEVCLPIEVGDDMVDEDDNLNAYDDDILEEEDDEEVDSLAPVEDKVLTELELEEKQVMMKNRALHGKVIAHNWYWKKLSVFLYKRKEPTIEFNSILFHTKMHYTRETILLENERLLWWKKCQAIKKRKQEIDGKTHACVCCLGDYKVKFDHSNVYKQHFNLTK